MKLLNTGRMAGKTYACLKFLNENRNAILVVHNSATVNHIVKKLVSEYGETKEYWGKRVFPPQSNSIRGRSGPILVDNVDLVLQYVYGGNVVGVTGTFEDW